MGIRVDHYFHEVLDNAAAIEKKLDTLLKEVKRMSEALDRLTAVVDSTEGTIDSAVALITGNVEAMRQLAADVAVQAARADSAEAAATVAEGLITTQADELEAAKNKLAAAVGTNPTPTPPVV